MDMTQIKNDRSEIVEILRRLDQRAKGHNESRFMTCWICDLRRDIRMYLAMQAATNSKNEPDSDIDEKGPGQQTDEVKADIAEN